MDWLNKVSQHHNEWIKYIHKMGKTSHAEDIVQEMYLKLVQYDKGDTVILDNGKVHKTYIWRVLHNMFLDYHNSAKKFNFIQVDKFTHFTDYENSSSPGQYGFRQYEYEQVNEIEEEAYERIMQRMFKELDELDQEGYPYNKELFNLYAGSAMSMRCISSVTKISLTSIFNTLKNCREQLSDELREDIEDFYNGDYELIK